MQLNRDVLEMTCRNRLNTVSINKTEDTERKMLNLEFPRNRVKIHDSVLCTAQLPTKITQDPEIVLRA